MTASRSRGRLRNVPADLVGVLVIVALAHAFVFHPALNGSPLRVIVGLPFALFVPGYALVAALFPGEGTSPPERWAEPDTRDRSWMGEFADSFRGIDRWERLGLAFALSLAAVPLVAMVVTLSPLAFGTATVLPAIGVFSVLCAVVAAKRRLALPPRRRFRVSPADWLVRMQRSLARTDSRGELLLSVGLAVAVVLAVGTLGFTVLAPPDGETYTEFYVLSENAEGDLVAADYPDSFQPGESQPLFVGIENYEHGDVDYDVVIQLQRVEGTGTDAVVTERTEIDRYSATLAHNETSVDERSLTAPEGWTGTNLRLEFLLYEDGIPETPTSENAYRSLHIWIDVGVEQNATTGSQNETTADATPTPTVGQNTTSTADENTTSTANRTATPTDDRTQTSTPGGDTSTATPGAQNSTSAGTPTRVAFPR